MMAKKSIENKYAWEGAFEATNYLYLELLCFIWNVGWDALLVLVYDKKDLICHFIINTWY